MDPHSGRPGYYGDGYHYSFKGQPSWLTVKDTSLVGTVPKTAFGNHQVTVSYRSKDGKRTGETVFILTTDVSSSTVAGLTSIAANKLTVLQSSTTNPGQLTPNSPVPFGIQWLPSSMELLAILVGHCSEPGLIPISVGEKLSNQ